MLRQMVALCKLISRPYWLGQHPHISLNTEKFICMKSLPLPSVSQPFGYRKVLFRLPKEKHGRQLNHNPVTDNLSCLKNMVGQCWDITFGSSHSTSDLMEGPLHEKGYSLGNQEPEKDYIAQRPGVKPNTTGLENQYN